MNYQRGFTSWEMTAAILLLSAIPAWLTHVIVCIKSSEWIFLLAGAIFAPIGVIHGWGVWFGIF